MIAHPASLIQPEPFRYGLGVHGSGCPTELGDCTLGIWCFELDGPKAALDDAWVILPAEERLRAARFFRKRDEGDASVFHLAPGRGVRVPVHAPHWVRNGHSISVSLSINYDLRSTKRLASVHRFNHGMRRAGLSPTPPGVSPWRDTLKQGVVWGARQVNRAGRAVPSNPSR